MDIFFIAGSIWKKNIFMLKKILSISENNACSPSAQRYKQTEYMSPAVVILQVPQWCEVRRVCLCGTEMGLN